MKPAIPQSGQRVLTIILETEARTTRKTRKPASPGLSKATAEIVNRTNLRWVFGTLRNHAREIHAHAVKPDLE